MRREASPIIHPLNCLLDSHYEGDGEKSLENEGDGRANLPTKIPKIMEPKNFSMKLLVYRRKISRMLIAGREVRSPIDSTAWIYNWCVSRKGTMHAH